MKHIALLLFLIVTLCPLAEAKGRSAAKRPTAGHTSTSIRATKPKPSRCVSCARNSKGRIARSAAARRSFQKAHPCPSTGRASGACPGYVIDHVVPLKRGGADARSNMQWQTKAAARAKDKVE